MRSDTHSIWIGLAEVHPRPGSQILNGAVGAFVNVLTWASDNKEFQDKAAIMLKDLGLVLVGIENPEPLTMRLRGGPLEADIMQAANELEYEPAGIKYTAFHTWRATDA